MGSRAEGRLGEAMVPRRWALMVVLGPCGELPLRALLRLWCALRFVLLRGLVSVSCMCEFSAASVPTGYEYACKVSAHDPC